MAPIKIYIAGPMTCYENYNYPAFFDMEEKLEKLKLVPINPAWSSGRTLEKALIDLDKNPDTRWQDYIRKGIALLSNCDSICLLPGWQQSKGARLEFQIAQSLGLQAFVYKKGKLIPRVSIIGFSGYARSGKDTAAQVLVNKGWKRASFADGIRNALFKLNPSVMIEVEKSDFENVLVNHSLQTVVNSLGWERAKHNLEIRQLLQRFGTEVGREMFGTDFWVEHLLNNLPDGSKIVIPDVRFPNEVKAIKQLGGQVFRIRRKEVEALNDHASEHSLYDSDFEHVLENTGNLMDFQYNVRKFLEETMENV